VLRAAGLTLTAEVPELGRTLGAELLVPTRIYARDCLALVAGTQVRAFAHITGGGIAGNLARVLPPDCDATVDRGTWTPHAVFRRGARGRRGPPRRAGPHLQPGGGNGRRAGRRGRGPGARDPAGSRPAGMGARRRGPRHRRGQADRPPPQLTHRSGAGAGVSPAGSPISGWHGPASGGPCPRRRRTPRRDPRRPRRARHRPARRASRRARAEARSDRCWERCTSAPVRPSAASPWPGRAPSARPPRTEQRGRPAY